MSEPQTNAARVSCSMPRDYSDRASLLRLLAALLKGDDTSPPAVSQRQLFLELARDHRVEHLAAWRTAQQTASGAVAPLQARIRESPNTGIARAMAEIEPAQAA